MKKKPIIILVLLVAGILIFSSALDSTANHRHFSDLSLSPIPVYTNPNLGDEVQEVELCSAHSNNADNVPSAPLLDGTGIFQDLSLKNLTHHPASPVAATTACAVSSFGTSG